jgi:hypothetical protein
MVKDKDTQPEVSFVGRLFALACPILYFYTSELPHP